MSSTVISWGMLIVLLIAPEMNGWAAAIILMCAVVVDEPLAVPAVLVRGVEYGEVLVRRCGAPSIVCVPQMWSLASPISAEVNPSALEQVELRNRCTRRPRSRALQQ